MSAGWQWWLLAVLPVTAVLLVVLTPMRWIVKDEDDETDRRG